MASTMLFVLLLRASFNIEQDLKSVNKSDATFDSSDSVKNKREAIISNYSCPEGMSWLTYHCVENDQYNKTKEDDYVDMTDSQVENTLSETSSTTQIPTLPYSRPTQTPRTLHTPLSSKYGPKNRHRKKPWPRPKSPGSTTTTWPRPSLSGLTLPAPSMKSRPSLTLPAPSMKSGPSLTLPAPSTTSGPESASVSRAETISLPTTTVLFALFLSVLQNAVLLLLI